jgi:hypothetical protein
VPGRLQLLGDAPQAVPFARKPLGEPHSGGDALAKGSTPAAQTPALGEPGDLSAKDLQEPPFAGRAQLGNTLMQLVFGDWHSYQAAKAPPSCSSAGSGPM